MIKSRRFLSLSLFAILLAACASAEPQTKPPELPPATSIVTGPAATQVVDLTATPINTQSQNSTPAPTVQAVATSRGPNLEATDPKTVSMASGGLQFVEFFEFW